MDVISHQKHPEAVDYVEEIKAIADSQGISYNKAFETSKFGKLIIAGAETDKEKKETIKDIPSTNNRISNTSEQDMKVAVEKFEKGEHGSYIRARMPDFFKEA